MEVHSHTHTARKKWTHYFWEFLMLFLAVTLGFFVENQREHLIEKQRAKDYARALIKDLSVDTTNINKWSGYYTRYVSLMDSMIAMTIQKKVNPATSGKFGWYCRFALWHLPLPWQRTTMEQIKSSGNIRYFKSYRLQEMIANYNIIVQGSIDFFFIENTASDKCRDLANKILDVETNYEYSKISLASLGTMSALNIDSITNRQVPLTDKEELVNELVNYAIYRRRNIIPTERGLLEIKKHAIGLINELKEEYHLK